MIRKIFLYFLKINTCRFKFIRSTVFNFLLTKIANSDFFHSPFLPKSMVTPRSEATYGHLVSSWWSPIHGFFSLMFHKIDWQSKSILLQCFSSCHIDWPEQWNCVIQMTLSHCSVLNFYVTNSPMKNFTEFRPIFVQVT